MNELLGELKKAIDASPDPVAAWNDVRRWVAEASGQSRQPVSTVLFVPIETVHSNTYNPNSVAKNEMRLLYTSIEHDGYTQPVVTFPDPAGGNEIVDGFHRYTTARYHPELLVNGLLPIVEIRKSISERMASTVRHNRARGKHNIGGMANMVFAMLEDGMTDEGICTELGLEADELIRLKYTTGFAKLFEKVEYRQAWETRRQIQFRTGAK